MPESPLKILLVDDDNDFVPQVKELFDGKTLAGNKLSFEYESDFDRAITILEERRIDLLLLDVRLGSKKPETEEMDRGLRVFEDLRRRIFVPVVFFTSWPDHAENKKSPMVRVFRKGDSTALLVSMVEELIASKMPAITRALMDEVRAVQRDYLWGFAERHWSDYGGLDKAQLAYLLARRLSMQLSTEGAHRLAQALGAPSYTGSAVHGFEYYIIPPPQDLFVGDLYEETLIGGKRYFICLTPTCDQRHGWKSLLFAACIEADQIQEYEHWCKERRKSGNDGGKFKSIVTDRGPNHYMFLPAAFDVPSLVVDFGQVNSLSKDKIISMKRLASLDTPYAAKLVSRFTCFYARMGAPDLDATVVLEPLSRNCLAPVAATASETQEPPSKS